MSKRNNTKPSRPRRPRPPRAMPMPVPTRAAMLAPPIELPEEIELSVALIASRAAAPPEDEPEIDSVPLVRVFGPDARWWDSGLGESKVGDMDRPLAECELFDALAIALKGTLAHRDRPHPLRNRQHVAVPCDGREVVDHDPTVMIDSRRIPNSDSKHAVLRYHRTKRDEIGQWQLDPVHPGPAELERVRLAHDAVADLEPASETPQ